MSDTTTAKRPRKLPQPGDRMVPVSVIDRGGVWAYRFRGWPSGRYLTTEILNDGTPKSRKAALEVAFDIWDRDKELKSGKLRLGEYMGLFFGPNCPRTPKAAKKGTPIGLRTKERNLAIIRRDLMGLAIAAVRVCAITTKEMEKASDEMVTLWGCCSKTFEAFKLLRTIVRTAYVDGLISRDPLLGVPQIKYQKLVRRPLDLEEVPLIFDPKNYPCEMAFAIFKLEYLCGLRKAEILALDWSQWDRRRGVLEINRAFKDRAYKVVGLPKWEHCRTVALGADATAHLEWWHAKTGFKKAGFVFSCFEDKRVRPTTYADWFDLFKAKTGIQNFTAHGLRHTRATDMAAAGTPIDSIADMFGWKDEKTRLNYTKITGTRQRKALERADNYLATGTAE